MYFGSWNGYEYAVNATDGTVDWQTFLGLNTICGVFTPMGISSTPAYSNRTLYLGGGNDSWYALNSTTGAIDWSFLAGFAGHELLQLGKRTRVRKLLVYRPFELLR